MDIYQKIWNADMQGNGIKPVLNETEGNPNDGYVVVTEVINGGDQLKLFPKVVIPDHKKSTYDLCKKLFNNYTLSQSKPEVNTPEEEQYIHEFVAAIITTKPMLVAREWLETQTGENYNDIRFSKLIMDIWFKQFTQSSGKDLSGFEHVIVGEQSGAKVSGYHFWYKYHLDDSNQLLDTDTIKYKGLKGGNIDENQLVPEVTTLSYSWDAFDYQAEAFRPLFKKIGGFFNGCSVEGLMALGTVRFVGAGRAPKEATINGSLYDMKLFRSSNGKNMRTFYPVFIKIVDPDNQPIPVNPEPPVIVVTEPDPNPVTNNIISPIRIVAAKVNPEGHDQGSESVTLLNLSPDGIDLNGWKIVDKNGNEELIVNVTLQAGKTETITLSGAGTQLSNKGGTITLLNAALHLVQKVEYTKQQASQQGWSIGF